MEHPKTQRNRVLPNLLSVVLHPLLMPVVGTLFLLFFSGLYITMIPIHAKSIILLIVGLCTLGLPVMLLLFYWTHRWIDIQASDRRKRIVPLILTAIFYYTAYKVLHSLHTPYIVQKFVLASTVCVFVTSLISLRWKISIHGVGIGGVTGMVAALAILTPVLIPVLFCSIMLTGMVGYARIRLNAHTPAQFYAGALLGCAIVFGMFFLA